MVTFLLQACTSWEGCIGIIDLCVQLNRTSSVSRIKGLGLDSVNGGLRLRCVATHGIQADTYLSKGLVGHVSTVNRVFTVSKVDDEGQVARLCWGEDSIPIFTKSILIFCVL